MHTLELVGLADKRRARADELSGGQQQRLAIARMLMQNPDVILADEPVASLDPALSEAITSLLLRLADEGQKRTLIVALHDVKLALSYFPRVVGLRDGRVTFDTPPANLQGENLAALYAGDDAKMKEAARRDVDPWCELRCAR